MPVLVNLFGTVERVAKGMNRNPSGLREIGETLAFMATEPPGSWKEAFAMMPLLKTVMAMKPNLVSSAPCQEVILLGDDINLGDLPIQTCWPGEPGPSLLGLLWLPRARIQIARTDEMPSIWASIACR